MALLKPNSKVNTITLTYTAKLDFCAQKSSIGAQKIHGLVVKTYGIALASF